MSDVRTELLRNVIDKISDELKYDRPDIEITAIPTTGANFTSQLFYATIKSKDKEDLNVFAKVAVVSETVRDQSGNTNCFDIEPHFYNKLAKAYREIEDKHGVPKTSRLIVPKFYGYSAEYLKEVLVLEDLSKHGFITWNRLKSIDWDYASKAIEELAKLHSLSIAYQIEYPDEYEEGKKILKREFSENSPMVAMLKQILAQVTLMIKEENRERLQKFFDENFKTGAFLKYYLPKKRPVITHSDFRQSNLLHRIDKNGKYQVVVVDYQTLAPGNASTDLLYFIFSGSDAAFRAQYFDRLIDHYYTNLAVKLRRLRLDAEEVFPRAVFDEELKESMPFGLIIACTILPLITIDIAAVPKAERGEYENESLEAMVDMMGKANALCAERLNEVVDDYIKWELL